MAKRVEDIYKRHIQSLTPEERIELITLASQDIEIKGGDKTTRRISELHGLGKELWQGIDANKLVDSLRNEWDV